MSRGPPSKERPILINEQHLGHGGRRRWLHCLDKLFSPVKTAVNVFKRDTVAEKTSLGNDGLAPLAKRDGKLDDQLLLNALYETEYKSSFPFKSDGHGNEVDEDTENDESQGGYDSITDSCGTISTNEDVTKARSQLELALRALQGKDKAPEKPWSCVVCRLPALSPVRCIDCNARELLCLSCTVLRHGEGNDNNPFHRTEKYISKIFVGQRWHSKMLADLGLVVHLCSTNRLCPEVSWKVRPTRVVIVHWSGVHVVSFRHCASPSGAEFANEAFGLLLARGLLLVANFGSPTAFTVDFIRMVSGFLSRTALTMAQICDNLSTLMAPGSPPIHFDVHHMEYALNLYRDVHRIRNAIPRSLETNDVGFFLPGSWEIMCPCCSRSINKLVFSSKSSMERLADIVYLFINTNFVLLFTQGQYMSYMDISRLRYISSKSSCQHIEGQTCRALFVNCRHGFIPAGGGMIIEDEGVMRLDTVDARGVFERALSTLQANKLVVSTDTRAGDILRAVMHNFGFSSGASSGDKTHFESYLQNTGLVRVVSHADAEKVSSEYSIHLHRDMGWTSNLDWSIEGSNGGNQLPLHPHAADDAIHNHNWRKLLDVGSSIARRFAKANKRYTELKQEHVIFSQMIQHDTLVQWEQDVDNWNRNPQSHWDVYSVQAIRNTGDTMQSTLEWLYSDTERGTIDLSHIPEFEEINFVDFAALGIELQVKRCLINGLRRNAKKGLQMRDGTLETHELEYKHRAEVYERASTAYLHPSSFLRSSTPDSQRILEEIQDSDSMSRSQSPALSTTSTLAVKETLETLNYMETHLHMSCAADALISIQVFMGIRDRLLVHIVGTYGGGSRSNANLTLKNALARANENVRRHAECYQQSVNALRHLWPVGSWRIWFKEINIEQLLPEEFNSKGACLDISSITGPQPSTAWIWKYVDYGDRDVRKEIIDRIRWEWVHSLAKTERALEEMKLSYIEMTRTSRWLRSTTLHLQEVSLDQSESDEDSRKLAMVQRSFYKKLREDFEREWRDVLKGTSFKPSKYWAK
ncbi:hypothetical protein SCHPADRAFT_885785 [Schizopora paradoxa]|uniref:CxC2-like cysteine cluster KDZ transposase-associated domain-containing protein n=1 Tax=Schizopora paradoxa TaxID=27342 RepID=A0A0H2S3L9_9AGAM|nr:hypothetical protein SCHPADRAFT_885785 [Schizopora paradoxa]